MNFWDTPLRRSRMLRAIYFFVIATIILIIAFSAETDDFGKVAAGVLFTFFFAFGCLLLWLAKRTPADVVVTSNPNRLPLPQRIRHYKRSLWVTPIAVAAYVGMLAYDLHQLESGAVKQVSIWQPMALLYEHFGYWPTVLCLPTVCLICTVIIWRKLRQAQAKLREEDGSAHKAATGGAVPDDGARMFV